MASIISAGTSSGTALNMTADTSGQLQLATGASATTAITIDTSQNVTFAKGFTVGATASPAFSAYSNSNQSLTASAFNKILFQVSEFDTNSNFASSKFTPTVAGYYLINTRLAAGPFNGECVLTFYKNGAIYKYSQDISLSTNYSLHGSALIYCNGSTDYIEIYVYAGSATTTASSNSAYTWVQGYLARSA